MTNLYIVATPIGNLEDISKRALRVLTEVDLILCEDTRNTQKLLNHFNIKTPTLSYYQHSKLKKINYIIELLQKGKNLALVSDAGTPGISDPGSKLINIAIEQCNNLTIVPVPGPSALISALSISGISAQKFLFLGFPPAKRKRKKFFKEVVSSQYPVVFYESPHRILKTLEELNETIKQCSNIAMKQCSSAAMKIVVCRELTKMFETIYRGNIKDVINKIKKDKIKGEFVVIVDR